MQFEFLDEYPIWLLLVFIVIGGIVVWVSGEKLSHYAGIIATRSGIGQAMIGAVLLGGVTSLPEIATTITASIIGSAPIAVNNIIGGVAMQIAVLVAADAFAKTALSYHIDNPKVKLQIIFNILLLTMVMIGILFSEVQPDYPLFTGLIILVYLGSFFLMNYIEMPKLQAEEPLPEQILYTLSKRRLYAKTFFASAAILVSGFVISVAGENIAGRTVFGENFIGAVLIAGTTSLPELSTTIAAVKEKNFNLAASNIFGSNMIILSLLFISDLAYDRGNVLGDVKDFSQFAALLGIILSTIYLIGITVKVRRVYFNLGLDSIIVMVLYFLGLGILYLMR